MYTSIVFDQGFSSVLQVDLQPRVGTSGSGVSREVFIGNVARDVSSKIPEPFDVPLLRKSIGVPSPTQVVLLQETERWNKVYNIALIHTTSLKQAHCHHLTLVHSFTHVHLATIQMKL